MSRQSGHDIDHNLTANCSSRLPYSGANEWRCWGLESMIIVQHFSRHKNVPTTRRARPFTCWSCISGPLLWLSTKSVQKAVQVPFTLTEAHLGNYWGRMLAFFRKQISFFFVWIPGICVVIFSATVLGQLWAHTNSRSEYAWASQDAHLLRVSHRQEA